MWNVGWDKIFKKYNWGKYPDLSIVRVLSKFSNLKNKKILEIGMGTAANFSFFSDKKLKIFGIDGSKIALKDAKKIIKKLKIKADITRGDINNLPYKNNYFDYVVDCECLYSNSKKDSKKILSEVNRVLKKNGYFFSKTFAKSSVGEGLFKKNKKHISSKARYIKKGYGVARISTLPEIKKLYSVDFEIKNIELEFRTYNYLKNSIKEWVLTCKKN